MRCVEEESGRFEPLEDRRVAEVSKGYTPFRDGDVLFAKVTPCMENGKAAVVQSLTNGVGFGSTEFFALRPKETLDAHFLLHFILQRSFRREAARNMTGAVGLRRVPKTYLEQQLIPFPPVPEQRRIVAEIEKQFTRLEAGVAALRRVQANLKRYRAAVLKATCEGRLVPTEAELAKTENRKFENGKELLKRILTERRSKWEQDQRSRFTTEGRTPKNEKWKSRYKEPDAPDFRGQAALPEGWVWVELGQLAWSVKDGPHYSPTYALEGVPFISGGNVRPSGVDFDNAKRITPKLHAELSKRCKPSVGDILYTKGGTTGIARVNTYAEEFSVWVHVAVLKLVDSVSRFYVQHTLNSPFCYAQAQKFTHGVGNQDLGLTRMIHIILALPPLAEQTRIVAEVERRLSVVDELDSVVTVNLQRATRLRQAILQRVFTGQILRESVE